MNTAIIDFRSSEEEVSSLEALGLHVIKCPSCNKLYPAVSSHPDMQLCIIDGKYVVIHRDMAASFIDILASTGINILYSHNSLSEIYPQDIILNSLVLGDIFVHKISSTDPVLLQTVKSKCLINVRQGYTKCSTAVLHDKAVMTSDITIAKALKEQGLDVLFLPPGDIELPGLNYGFIGGTCGLISEGVLAFFGELSHYAYGSEVLAFLNKHKIEPVSLKKGKLIDRGSLFCL